MLGLSWTELLVIAVTAVIFIGPKELPGTLRAIAKWVSKARGLAREFQGGVDDMIRHAEFEDIRKHLQKIESVDVSGEIQKAVDPKGTIAKLLSQQLPAAVDPLTGEPLYATPAVQYDDRNYDDGTPSIVLAPAPKPVAKPVAAPPPTAQPVLAEVAEMASGAAAPVEPVASVAPAAPQAVSASPSAEEKSTIRAAAG
ncbi:MAG: twin-arginine translocase subunit TatB [Rhodospirillaceae bacterium]|nr:twin-arginine translocase subunit TatB [Rhodospirillaceae bacterium]